MISSISGSGLTHKWYEPRQLNGSVHNIPENYSRLSDNLFGPQNVDVLQWQPKLTSHRAYSSVQRQSIRKDYIRENVRRLRQQQEVARHQFPPPSKRVPYSSAFVPVDDSTKSISDERPHSTLPPRPFTPVCRASTICSDRRMSMMTYTCDTDSTPGQRDSVSPKRCVDLRVRRQHLSSAGTYDCDCATLDTSRTVNRGVSVGTLYPDDPEPVVKSRYCNGNKTAKCCRATQFSGPGPNQYSQGVQTDDVYWKVQTPPGEVEYSDNESSEQAGDVEIGCIYTNRGRCNNVDRPRMALTTTPPTPGRDFMRAHTKGLGKVQDLQTLSRVPIRPCSRLPRPEQLTVPKASLAKKVNLIRRDINFVRANAHLASLSPSRLEPIGAGGRHNRQNSESPTGGGHIAPRRAVSASGPGGDARTNMWPQRRLPVGVLPNYLVKRRQEAMTAMARSEANRPDPDQPPGHQRMPDSERVATLDLLRHARQDLTEELGRLPIRNDTLRLKTRRSEIEKRLLDVEDAIRIFSKPKVFIRPE